MLRHMKTTLNIADPVMERLRQESARTGRTMSELMETALRRLLEAPDVVSEIEPLPAFSGGRALVDIADRDALFRAMEER
jgi:urease gamma subunit